MKRPLLTFAVLLLTMLAAAQTVTPHRAKKMYFDPFEDWDSTRVYRQIVVLYEFNDTTFSMPDPQAYYDSILNVPGFNKGAGPGCAADYLQAQSNGLLHIHLATGSNWCRKQTDIRWMVACVRAG